jgi:glutamyl-tRNA(Gln) amidotransferase subunit E
MKEYSLNDKLAKQIIDSEYGGLFEVIAKESGVSATTISVFLTESLKALKRDGVQTEKVADEQIKEIFQLVGSGELTKEAIPDVFSWLSKNEEKTVPDAIEALGLKMLTREELERLIDRLISENKPSVDRLGKNAFGMLMGIVMKEVKGKADPELVSKLLKERLN